MGAGRPEPLGAAVVTSRPPAGGGGDPRDVSCAVNFAVFSRHASSIQLCLVRVKLPEDDSAAGGGGAMVQLPVALNVLEVSPERLWGKGWEDWMRDFMKGKQR